MTASTKIELYRDLPFRNVFYISRGLGWYPELTFPLEKFIYVYIRVRTQDYSFGAKVFLSSFGRVWGGRHVHKQGTFVFLCSSSIAQTLMVLSILPRE